MMNRKAIINRILVVFSVAVCMFMLCSCGDKAYADTDKNLAAENTTEKSYYTNINGIDISKEQYLNLLKGFNPDDIYVMPEDIVKMYANDDTLETSADLSDNEVFFVNYPAQIEMTYNQYRTLVEKDYTPEEIKNMTSEEFNNIFNE